MEPQLYNTDLHYLQITKEEKGSQKIKKGSINEVNKIMAIFHAILR
jgi:hypothetical protein